MKDNLLAWWNSLAYREQQLLGVCSVFFVIGIFYWGIWTPLSNAEENAQQDLQKQQRTLTEVKQKANRIIALKKSGAKTSKGGSLSSIVNTTASTYGLAISRMQPQGNKIQVWMDEVPFDALLGYLDDVVQKKGLSLDNLDIAETDAAGIVKVRRIQFSR
ncbi:type II secretion system protein M [Shewanella sp. OPT22]|uniref:type II secretion system protein M n=1 Tax=Parashewanella hymeniacidonis TaxID=2807618 RepID=UPI00101EC3E4|nr:type II secretion system protein M [Parashewanella hymeniacidonis]MBM7071115.1 type II secretion system protein M [Parashewanella hymeniacidonis]RYV03687.1 type II secretion system protein M [Shewanella sp. OPT22]